MKISVFSQYLNPTLIQSDTLETESTIISPCLAGKISFKTNAFDIMLAGVLRMNRVQFTSDDKGSQSEIGYEGLIAAKFLLNERNRFMMSVSGGTGMERY